MSKLYPLPPLLLLPPIHCPSCLAFSTRCTFTSSALREGRTSTAVVLPPLYFSLPLSSHDLPGSSKTPTRPKRMQSSPDTPTLRRAPSRSRGRHTWLDAEKTLHAQRNPGHTEFVDQTGENEGGVSYDLGAPQEAEDEELKKAVALSMGKNPDTSQEGDDVMMERVTDKVSKDLLAQLVEMGFSDVRGERALWMTGSSSLEDAVAWLAEHSEDKDIDEPLQVPAGAKSKLSKEEQKQLLEERLAKMRKVQV
eukprot:747905-Hanusia_phi.AAC.1